MKPLSVSCWTICVLMRPVGKSGRRPRPARPRSRSCPERSACPAAPSFRPFSPARRPIFVGRAASKSRPRVNCSRNAGPRKRPLRAAPAVSGWCALDRRGERPYSLPFGLVVHFPTVQRSEGSAGVEALPGCARWGWRSFDKYCGVKLRRPARSSRRSGPAPEARKRGPVELDQPRTFKATPQKSFGPGEARIHTRPRTQPEHPSNQHQQGKPLLR